MKRPDLDRSDSFSSAEEDDEDFFEVFTADSLFSNLLDRVRNLTKRINREGSVGPNWPNDPNFGLWSPSSSLRDLMARYENTIQNTTHRQNMFFSILLLLLLEPRQRQDLSQAPALEDLP